MKPHLLLTSVFLIYPCFSLADSNLIIDRYSVLILNNSAQDQKAKFVYISEFDNYFKQLNAAISKRDAVKDAKQALERNTVFLISNYNKSPSQPDLTSIDSYYHDKLYRVCPVKTLQADNPSAYIDTYKLDYFRLKKPTVKPKEALLKYDERNKQYLLPDSYKPYALKAYLYAKAWNAVMWSHCLKRVDIPDEKKQEPVKVKHQLVGKIAFVLEDSPLLKPNKGYGMMSTIEERIYKQRLLKALQISNPESNALSSIAHNEIYFLGTRKHSLGLNRDKIPVTGHRRLSRSIPAAPRLLPDFAANTNSGENEFLFLQRVCPTHELEAQYFYDANLITARQHYAEQWNKQMLLACRVKLEQTITTERQRNELNFAKAKDAWLRKQPITYTFKLQDQSSNPAKLLQVTIKNEQVIKAIDLKTKTLLSKDQLSSTFEMLFNAIEQTIVYERSSKLEVTYHSSYGYPTKLKITPPANQDKLKLDYLISEVQLS